MGRIQLTHRGDCNEGGDAGAVVAKSGDTAVVGCARQEAGDGHYVRRNSNRFLNISGKEDIAVEFSHLASERT